MTPRDAIPHLILAITLCTHLACGEDKSVQKVKVTPGRISWSVTRIAEIAPERPEFQSAINAMVGRLPPFPKRPPGPSLNVSGIFDEIGGEGAIIIEAALEGSEAGVPMEAAVVIHGRISGRKSAVDLMNKGAEELEVTLRSLFRVYGGTATNWQRSLNSAEPDEQILAARLLARDRVTAAVESIGKLLDDPREQVAEAAAVALGDMGDESAVPVLIRSMNPRALRSEVRAIEAMARIGGREASAYLEMTAEGHENPEVRELSKGALERMRKKR